MFCHGSIFEKFFNVVVNRCLDSLTLPGILCTTKSTRIFISGFVVGLSNNKNTSKRTSNSHSLVSCIESIINFLKS